MKILFLSLVKTNIEDRGIYSDLMRKFHQEGHHLYIVTPTERRDKKNTELKVKNNVSYLNVRTFNLQKTNIFEKGLGTIAIEYQFLNAIKKYFKDIKFDLVLYSTPPITFSKIISYIKKRDGAYAYLLLKDIFPQNAVDMGLIRKGSFIHKFFQQKERKLYEISDTIGCMSPANVKYILTHNPEVSPSKIEVNPNSIEPLEFTLSDDEQKYQIRQKYKLPQNKKIFVYGGNLGKPQGLEFLLQTITANINTKAYFLIVGSGTEFPKIDRWFKENKPQNAKLLKSIPKSDYDLLLAYCDIGLLFLDRNFTIPNFPSRLLSYLEMGMPVIAATDKNTDIGNIIEEAKCGIKVLAGNIQEMQNAIDFICVNSEIIEKMSRNALNLLYDRYVVENSYNPIIAKLDK